MSSVIANDSEYDYIIFSAYYKHGETETKICNSFYSLFKEVLKTIFEFTGKYLDSQEDEEDYEEDTPENNKEILETYKDIYMKYKKLFEKRKHTNRDDLCFSIFMNEIAIKNKDQSDIEKEFLEDILFMNKYLLEECESWSIRTICKIKKNSYSYFNNI